jgi:hypothetical protein
MRRLWALTALFFYTPSILYAQERWHIQFSPYNSIIQWNEHDQTGIDVCKHLPDRKIKCKMPKGLQFGISYIFSEDFSIGFSAIGFSEEKLHLGTNKVYQPSSLTPTPPLASPQQLNIDTPELDTSTDPNNIDNDQPLSDSGIASLGHNPWEETTPPDLQRTASAPLAGTSPIFEASPKTPYVTKLKLDIPEPVEKIATDKIAYVYWSGCKVLAKCNLIHLHPRYSVYWAPGGFLLKSLNQAGILGAITLGIGLHAKLHSRVTIDIAMTAIPLRYGSSEAKDSKLYRNKPEYFSISFHWHWI